MRSMDFLKRMSFAHCTQKTVSHDMRHSPPICSCMLSVQPVLAEKHDINTPRLAPRGASQAWMFAFGLAAR